MDTELATTPELAGEPELVLIGGGCLVRANLLEDRATHFFDWLLSDFDAVVHFFEHIDDDDAFGPAAWTLDDVRARQHARLGMYRKVEHRQLTLVSLHDFAHRGAPRRSARGLRRARRAAARALVALLERAARSRSCTCRPAGASSCSPTRASACRPSATSRACSPFSPRAPALRVHGARQPGLPSRARSRAASAAVPPNARAHALTAVGRPDGDGGRRPSSIGTRLLRARAGARAPLRGGGGGGGSGGGGGAREAEHGPPPTTGPCRRRRRAARAARRGRARSVPGLACRRRARGAGRRAAAHAYSKAYRLWPALDAEDKTVPLRASRVATALEVASARPDGAPQRPSDRKAPAS